MLFVFFLDLYKQIFQLLTQIDLWPRNKNHVINFQAPQITLGILDVSWKLPSRLPAYFIRYEILKAASSGERQWILYYFLKWFSPFSCVKNKNSGSSYSFSPLRKKNVSRRIHIFSMCFRHILWFFFSVHVASYQNPHKTYFLWGCERQRQSVKYRNHFLNSSFSNAHTSHTIPYRLRGP